MGIKLIRQVGLFIEGVVKFMIFCILAGICVLVYARYIEPELLVTNEINIAAKALNLGVPLKIVQCSDIHLGPDYNMAHLERLVKKINEAKPDILVFTGDLVDNNKTFKDKEETIRMLTKVQARYGKYAVAGNHDYGSNGIKHYKEIMKAANFQLLMNECKSITLENGKVINIIGIDDAIFGKVDLEAAMSKASGATYNIVLCHEPDLADEIARYPIDLQLSGHSHGGQVRLPLKGAILTPPKGSKYVKGLYAISENPRMKLYVNTGIGTSQMCFRLGNIPELTVINLN